MSATAVDNPVSEWSVKSMTPVSLSSVNQISVHDSVFPDTRNLTPETSKPQVSGIAHIIFRGEPKPDLIKFRFFAHRIHANSSPADRLLLRPNRFSLFIKSGHAFNRIRPGGLGGHHLFGQVVGLPFSHVYLLVEMLLADSEHP